MVPPARLELATRTLKVCYSTRLSYEGNNFGPGGGTRTRTLMIKSQLYCQLILRPDIRFRYLSERFRLYLLIVIFL